MDITDIKDDAVVDIALICRIAGARFRSIQRGNPELDIADYVLFDDPQGSTLALPIEDFCSENVRREMVHSSMRWYVEKIAETELRNRTLTE